MYGGGVSNTNPSEELPEVIPEAIVHVDIDADPDAVWQALATDEGLASWIGEGSTVGTEVGDEIRVHDAVTGRDRRGYLDEVTPGRRLGYTWWPDAQPDQATRVAISLEPRHGGTRVTVIESRPLVVTGAGGAPLATAMACAGGWAWRLASLTVMAPRVAMTPGRIGARCSHG